MYPGIRRPGPYGGYLGSQYDPLFSLCEPTYSKKPDRPYYGTAIALGEPIMPASDALPDMSANRLDRRRTMLQQIDGEFERVTSSKSSWGPRENSTPIVTSCAMATQSAATVSGTPISKRTPMPVRTNFDQE